MKQFAYDATNAAGEILSGVVQAESLSDAISQLEAQDLQVKSIRKVIEENNQSPESHWQKRLEKAVARRKEWIPALQALADDLPSGHAKSETKRVYRLLQSNFSASQVLHDTKLSQLLPLLVLGTEDKPSQSRLNAWFAELIRQRAIRHQRRQALVYPIGIILLALGVTALLSIFVVPIFKEMFEEFGLMLPAPTLLLISVSDMFTERWLTTTIVLAIVFSASAFGIYVFKKLALGNFLFGAMLNGTTANLRAMSVLCGNLAELIHIGAPVPDALELAGSHCGNPYYFRSARLTALAVRGGLPIATGSNSARILPSSLLYALEKQPDPEHADTSVEILRELADIYMDRSSRHTDWIAMFFPSAAVVLVGFLIGFVVISLFMPLVTMVSSLA
ncbi:MAG: type II secretion system F family protein [Planctomycetota bacterium]